MPVQVMQILMLSLVFLSTALAAWGAFPDLSQRLIRQRLFAEVAKEKRPTFLDQLVKSLAPVNRLLPLYQYNLRAGRMLEAAGSRLSPLHFLVIQEMSVLTWILIYAVTMGRPVNIVGLVFCILAGWFVPVCYVRNRVQTRRLSIARDLPEVSDLLNLCVGAGSDFMGGMGRIIREFRTCPVREELGIVLQEIRVGKRRRDALRAFSDRIKSPEASTFARTLIQVDRMGTGLADALKILSEDMRLTRYHWAERYAQQAPLKMLIPLLFSLAAALIIVAGPILMQFLNGDFGMPNAQQQGITGSAE